jgi:polyisoprenoid-binding protein YceI
MTSLIGRRLLPALALLLSLELSAPLAHAAPRRYVLDPSASRLTVHVGKTGLFGFAGHEHEVVAGTFLGSATFDPDQIAQSTLDLTFQAGALRVVEKSEPPGDAPQVQATMVGPDCLDATRFATVHFVSKTVTGDGHELTIAGDLTLHGVTRPLTIRVHVEIKGDALDATGSTTLRQTDFGITPISKAGVVKVKDELSLDWHLHGKAP